MKNSTKAVAVLALGLAGTSLLPMGAYAHDGGAHDQGHKAEHTRRSTVEYTVPQVTLLREDGRTVSLPEELNDGRPVVLNFFYTKCTEVCPLTSSTFMQFQVKLGAEREKVHMVSISVDPEQDTPEVLRDYARKFHAGPAWHHYSGTVAASIEVQQAFDVYLGDKMNHVPVTLMRAAPGKPWLRIEGFSRPDDLVREYRNLVAAQ